MTRLDAAPIASEYRARLTARRTALAADDRWHARLGKIRLVIVLTVLLIAAIWGFDAGWWYAVPASAFAAAAIVHAVVLGRRTRAAHAVGFYERGLARLSHAWIGTGDAGDRYRPPDHPYADDLDLFGRGSAFELLGTARTEGGQHTIARWLLEAAPVDVVRDRQDAVRELIPRLDLRETLAVQGDTTSAGVDSARLGRWAAAPSFLAQTWPRVVLAALSAGVLAIGVSWIHRGTLVPIEGRALLILLTIEAAFAGWLHQRVTAVVRGVELPAYDLGLLAGVLRTMEHENVSAGLLRRIHHDLGGTTHRASSEIARLDRLVGVVQSRHNLIFAIVAAATACTTQVAFAIEAWRARVGPHVPRWLAAVGEFEALLACAGYAAEHPDHVFPDLASPGVELEAAQLAHPLLPGDAVTNDVTLGGAAPHLLVVSGSNMSGKSTLLRAIGLNAVLAQAGAPVRAAWFRMSPLAVAASIRIQDSLTEGRSRFLAEILRLRQIVDLTRTQKGATLFLLDEILGGTNSHDRRVGAEAVLRGLVGLGAIGLITTHDLSLGAVADTLAPLAANVHFADVFDGGGLTFDYRLRPGIVQTSNALALMRSIGLDVSTAD